MELDQAMLFEQIKMTTDLYNQGIKEGIKIGRAQASQEFAVELGKILQSFPEAVVEKDVERTDEPKEIKPT